VREWFRDLAVSSSHRREDKRDGKGGGKGERAEPFYPAKEKITLKESKGITLPIPARNAATASAAS